jgi:hypothetical protein
VLIMLLLDAPDLRVPRELRNYLADLNKRISQAHVDHLKTLGVETHHIRDWERLISMRYEEYARDKHEVRGAAMQIESANPKPRFRRPFENPATRAGASRVDWLPPPHLSRQHRRAG